MEPDLTGFRSPRDPGHKDELLDLSGAGLSGKRLDDADLEDVQLRGADVSQANLAGATLTGLVAGTAEGEPRTNFNAVTFSGAVAHGADFRRANFTTADLRNMYVHGTDFAGARLDFADLRELKCGEDTDAWHPCEEEELRAMGLPARADRPPTACWPEDVRAGRRASCGADAGRARAERTAREAQASR